MAESSTLMLMIEKGPREGETLQYRSGTVVTIGCLLRGNTIGIKDGGISKKHICIRFDNESCRWVLSDLNSSNGTILNGQRLKPNVPAGLKDGDCIEITKLTSISVKIGAEEKRSLRSRVVDLKNEVIPIESKKTQGVGKRGRRRKLLDLEKMTLGEFFDCLKVQFRKEIDEKTEKILSDLKEKARKCHEFRLQRKENGEGKLAMG